MTRIRNWLVTEPLPARMRRGSVPRFRSEAAANAVLSAVCQFLRFGLMYDWVPA
jgi:integrase/recombinase XerD